MWVSKSNIISESDEDNFEKENGSLCFKRGLEKIHLDRKQEEEEDCIQRQEEEEGISSQEAKPLSILLSKPNQSLSLLCISSYRFAELCNHLNKKKKGKKSSLILSSLH